MTICNSELKMHKYIKDVPGLHDRKVGGRALYSHVVIAQPGDWIFISGQLPRGEEGQVVGKNDMAGQIGQVMANIQCVLEAADASVENLVQTTTYTTHIDEYFENVGVRMNFFADESLPTSTVVEVSRLSNPAFMVEIEGIAIKR